MFRTLVLGFIIGVCGAAATAWYAPVVDLHRERSLISVEPNGGNVEIFHINLPRDRVLVGLSGDENAIPADLEWPGADKLGQFQAEIFKVRDRNDTVVGVASRLASASEPTGAFIEWVLNLPARGTLYVGMQVTPSADGVREGRARSGTGDFARLTGGMRERYVSDVEPEFDIQGRIELVTSLVGPLGDEQ